MSYAKADQQGRREEAAIVSGHGGGKKKIVPGLKTTAMTHHVGLFYSLESC